MIEILSREEIERRLATANEYEHTDGRDLIEALTTALALYDRRLPCREAEIAQARYEAAEARVAQLDKAATEYCDEANDQRARAEYAEAATTKWVDEATKWVNEAYHLHESLADMTESRDSWRDSGLTVGQALAALTAERDRLRKALEGFERINQLWLPLEVPSERMEEARVLHAARDAMLAALAPQDAQTERGETT